MLVERSIPSPSSLVKVRGVLLVPNVRDRVVVLDGRSSSILGMVVPLVDEGPGEEGEQHGSPGKDVADGSLKVLGSRNVGNRVLDKGVNVGLGRHSLGHLELDRDLGDGGLGVTESGRGPQQSRGSHGHHSRGLKSSDSGRLHFWLWWWLL